MPKKRGTRLLKTLGLIIGLGFVTLVVIKLLEDARGKKAWDNYIAEQRAKGAKILWEDFIPPEIPDENNFARYPDLDLKSLIDLDESKWPNQATPRPIQPGWRFAQTHSLLLQFKEGTAESEQDAARQLIAHFARHEGLLETLRAATARTDCRFHLNYANPQLIDFPLQEVQYGLRALVTLALANLHLDQPAEAYNNLLAAIRLTRHLDAAPSLIVAIVQTGQMDRTLQVVWEGLRDHVWTAAQLDTISENLSNWDARQRFITSLKQDRAGMFTIMHHQSQTSQQVMLRGWSYQNMVTFGSLLDKHVFAPTNTLDYHKTLDLDADVEKRRTRLFGRFPHPYDFFALIALPSLSKMTSRVLQLETNLKLAQHAIDLERIYQNTQAYPEALETTGLIIYRKKADGSPQIYSIALNSKNDGGTPDKDSAKGDWVWQYTSP